MRMRRSNRQCCRSGSQRSCVHGGHVGCRLSQAKCRFMQSGAGICCPRAGYCVSCAAAAEDSAQTRMPRQILRFIRGLFSLLSIWIRDFRFRSRESGIILPCVPPKRVHFRSCRHGCLRPVPRNRNRRRSRRKPRRFPGIVALHQRHGKRSVEAVPRTHRVHSLNLERLHPLRAPAGVSHIRSSRAALQHHALKPLRQQQLRRVFRRPRSGRDKTPPRSHWA